jgi:hypothetical protein
MSTFLAIHQNPHVLDYLASRYFAGFTLRGLDDQIALSSNDGTIISILARAKFIKDEDAEQISIDVASLVAKRVAIKKAVRDLRMFYDPEAIDLSEALNTIHAFCDPDVKQRLVDGFVMYTDLPVLFPRGTEVICQTPNGALGGTVDSCNELTSMFGNYYAVTLLNMIPTNKGATLGKIVHRVSQFESKMAIGKLGIRPISEQEKHTLTERGRSFNAFTQGPTIANYAGIITIPSWFRDRVMGADGRVMVDAANFAQIDADTYHDMMRIFQIDDDGTSRDGEHSLAVSDDDLWRCYHRVQGFSMRLKRWGWLDVESLSPVIWRDNAFDQLVLNDKQKKSMLHLVKHYGSSFADFIDGKSGGLIFLLHGSVGCGKTLSAEAVAETLHRPLYSVSVGELGTTPEAMEDKLRSILDLAYQWNAVLLLDEADIFMEARDTTNVQRNAMVSIFLRQLEYYSGVMFLTTNRVSTFDPAFFSRISLAINYPRLDWADRQSVWHNVLDGAGVDTTELDLSALAKYEVNGRNIKTAVRIAQTMAAGNARTVRQDDIVEVLGLTETFNRLIKA